MYSLLSLSGLGHLDAQVQVGPTTRYKEDGEDEYSVLVKIDGYAARVTTESTDPPARAPIVDISATFGIFALLITLYDRF